MSRKRKCPKCNYLMREENGRGMIKTPTGEICAKCHNKLGLWRKKSKRTALDEEYERQLRKMRGLI